MSERLEWKECRGNDDGDCNLCGMPICEEHGKCSNGHKIGATYILNFKPVPAANETEVEPGMHEPASGDPVRPATQAQTDKGEICGAFGSRCTLCGSQFDLEGNPPYLCQNGHILGKRYQSRYHRE